MLMFVGMLIMWLVYLQNNVNGHSIYIENNRMGNNNINNVLSYY
jgi:hypothetical protein